MVFLKCEGILLMVILSVNIKSGSAARGYTEWEPFSEDGLPQMYAIGDFFKCEEQQGTFCKVEIRITPEDPNSNLAKEISKSSESRLRLLRSSVYRMMCIPKESNDTVEIKDYIKRVVGEELKEYNVTLEVVDYSCNVNRPLNMYDYLLWAILLLSLWIIYKATTYDLEGKKPRDNWVKILSIGENWEKITKNNTNTDFQKLKSIQGIRLLTSILIIILHSKISIGHLYIDNPKSWEETVGYKLFHNSFHLDWFLVQIYFLISTFLLTNQIYELHRRHGHFSLTHCFKMYINRLFRFFPTLAVVMISSFATMKLLPQGTIPLDYFNMFWDGAHSWWATLLQINYIFKITDMCIPGAWYLSVDTFLYVTTIVLLYVQLKYQLDIKKVLAVTFIGTTLIFAYIIHAENLDIMFRPDIESFNRLLLSPDFEKLYISPFSSWNTCCVGIAMGAIYFHNKNKKIEINPVLQKIWLVTFFLLPALVVYVSTYEYEGLNRAIVGSLLKPTFVLGLGIGILGMSHGLGGVVKKILEWDFAVKMSHFTYCTYIFQFLIVFSRGIFTRTLTHHQMSDLVIYIFQDVTLSFMAGISMTILVEYPGVTLQKMIVPQIEKSEKIKTEENGIKIEANGAKEEGKEASGQEEAVKTEKNGVKVE